MSTACYGYYAVKQRRSHLEVARLTAWAAGQAVVIGDRRKSFNFAFQAVSNGTTGAIPPYPIGAGHASVGQVSDGAVTWQHIETLALRGPP